MVKYPKLAKDAIFEPVTLMHSFHFSETSPKCEGNGSGCNLNIPVPYNILVHVPGVFVGLRHPFWDSFCSKFCMFVFFVVHVGA